MAEPADLAELDDGDAVDLDNNVRRFQGVNIGGDTVTQATKALPEREKLLIRWLHDCAREENWTWDETAANVGLSRTVLFRVFKGNYILPDWLNKNVIEDGKKKVIKVKNPRAGERISLGGVCEKIERLKRELEKGQSLFSVGFLKTFIWERIEWGCMQALKRNRIVFIYGDGQVGKTTCGQEFARQHNGGQTSFARIPPSGGSQALLKIIAKSLKVNANKNHDALRDDVINSLDKSKLLMLDEIHEIFECYPPFAVRRCMEEIRYIYDKSHCGMVLFGTKVFRDGMREGQFFQMLKQLGRRGLYEINLPGTVPDSDLNLALDSFDLSWPTDAKTEQEFRHLAQSGFGQVLTRLEDGKIFADKKGQAYTWEHFTKAAAIVRRMALEDGK